VLAQCLRGSPSSFRAAPRGDATHNLADNQQPWPCRHRPTRAFPVSRCRGQVCRGCGWWRDMKVGTIEPYLDLAPVVIALPVTGTLLDSLALHVLGPINDGLLQWLWPAQRSKLTRPVVRQPARVFNNVLNTARSHRRNTFWVRSNLCLRSRRRRSQFGDRGVPTRCGRIRHLGVHHEEAATFTAPGLRRADCLITPYRVAGTGGVAPSITPNYFNKLYEWPGGGRGIRTPGTSLPCTTV
jgi:hypothetical protein